MPSGGHARSGPPPDPNALRRERDHAEWTHLPATGRQGDIPSWPLSAASKRELALWVDEWTRPQALMWERDGQEIEVALYVRAVIVAEGRRATASDRTLAHRLMDSLGLTHGGLARNRWIIDHDPIQTKVTRADDPDRSSAKARFQTLEGGAAS